MGKRTETTHRATPTITMPHEVDLSTYGSLDITFKNGKGLNSSIFSVAARMTAQPGWPVNFLGLSGELSTAMNPLRPTCLKS